MATANIDLQSAIDTRLQDALASANLRISLNNQKNNARLKLQNDLLYSTNGGTFYISQHLISFISALITCGKTEAIVIDNNSNPIEITDLNAFQENILDVYYQGTNEFLTEFKSIQRSRTVKAAVGE